MSQVAPFSVCLRPSDWLLPGLSVIFGVCFFFFCVLYYIVKGILAETLVFGVRGEWDSRLFTLGGESIFRTSDYFPSTPMYRKTKLRPQSRVLMKSTKKELKFSEGNLLKEINNKLRTYFSNYGVLSSTFCLSLPLFIK